MKKLLVGLSILFVGLIFLGQTQKNTSSSPSTLETKTPQIGNSSTLGITEAPSLIPTINISPFPSLIIKPSLTVKPTLTIKPTVIYIPPTSAPAQYGLSNDNYYKNSAGNEVHSPAYSNSIPPGATARCGDGTYSFSQSRRGTCSGHGGVADWL